MATCEQCGTEFDRDPSDTWKRLCVSCWTSAKAGGIGSEKVLVNLEERVGALEVQVIWLVNEAMARGIAV